jgi:adenylosuccinate lyase
MPENRRPFDYLSPLDARYYGTDTELYAALHPYLSEDATLAYRIKVEQALIAELEASGLAPAGTSAQMAEAVRAVTAEEVYAEERRIRHDVRALVNCICARLPEDVRGCVHLFATSYDIVDTARAVQMRDFARHVLLPDLSALGVTMIGMARAQATTVQIGRTHGRHAEPITVGYWLANHIDRLGQRAEMVALTAGHLRGKFSGAVGAHNQLALQWPADPAEFERRVLQRLGLRPSDRAVATQIVQPEFLTDFGHALVSTLGVLANIADDFRHLMRSEIDELAQRTDRTQVGSSTMPHKVNPVNFENVKSLWKAFVPRMVTLYMDQISEHQRDLTNSASSRFFNELVAAVDYAARRLRAAIADTDINPQAIERNLRASSAWIIAEPLYIALALSGHTDPYETSRELIERAVGQSKSLAELVRTDPDARRLVDGLEPQHQAVILDPSIYVGDAAQRTHLVCEVWEERLEPARLGAALRRPGDHTLVA